MHHSIIKTAALAAALVLSASLSSAAENKSQPSAEAVTKAKTTDKSAKTKSAKKAPIKLVDINSASKAELKKLPGVGDAEATKIVAGRPYLTKADLVTRNIIPTGIYEGLKRRIIAKQK